MGRYTRTFVIVAALLILAIVAAYLVPFTAEVCDVDEHTGAKYCPRDYIPNIIFWSVARWIDDHNGVITAFATIIIAGFTGTLWRATSGMLSAAADQGTAMEQSTAEAAKSAAAMVSVAESMRENVDRIKESVAINKEVAERQKLLGETQLRAYISITIGSAVYQDRANNLKFQGIGGLVNSGATPAQKLKYRTRSGIFPVPLPPPEDFVLLLPSEWSVEDMIPPHSPIRTVGEAVADYVDDAIIEDIKRIKGIGLYVWGEVTYEDEFGAKHETKFCHLLNWLPTTPNETIRGYYISGRNSMT